MAFPVYRPPIPNTAGDAPFETGLIFRVADPSRFFEGSEGLIFVLIVGALVDGVNADQSVLEIGVERKTAPGPVLGMIDQFSFQRIHVHIVEFFNSLLQTLYIEIIEAALPKARQRIIATCKNQIQLSGGRSPLAKQAARGALFQDLNYRRRRSFNRFADEQMNVFRHDNVAHQGEAVTVAHLAKNLDKNISGTNRAQERQTSIASKSNEMQMAASVVANEFIGHERKEKPKPRPFKTEISREIGPRHAAKGVIGERRLVAVRVGDADMQLSMNKSKSKAPPVTRRDRWATWKFKTASKAVPPVLIIIKIND